jgi:predicted subunit of tRNA(5-methylaminomethyl-2-thiouridylate) methyltransferase
MDKILVLYSGGTDSTLAASIAAEKVHEVHLVSYYRFGLLNSKKGPLVNLARLKKKYPATKFTFNVVNIEKEYKMLVYKSHFSDLIKFGFRTISVCGSCKVAMHWKTIQICKERAITQVFDGASARTKIFPAQNRIMMLDALRDLYKGQGIDYKNPVYTQDSEQLLFKRKIIQSKKVKGTKKDIQNACSQQLLFIRFAELFLCSHTFSEYELALKQFYDTKLRFVEGQIKNE